MNRARTRVLVAPEWSSNIPSTSGAVNTEVSLKERLSHLVSAGVAPHAEDRATNGLEVAKAAPTCTRNDSLQPGSAAVAPSPVPEPASSTAVPPQVLYPPPIPPYIALRSAWPEAALLDLVKQQALYPTDVNVRIGQPWMGAEPAGPPQSRLLHAVSNESQANIVATPASASSQLLRLLAEVCSRSCSSSSNPSFSGCGSNTSNSGGAVAAGGGGAIPPPPPDLAPALTLAAAAAATAAVPACPPGHSEVVLPPLEATQLPTPAALVGFQGEWLAVQPQVLRCWDKVSLEPCGPPKAAHFYLLCPEQHASAARMFVKDLSATFLAMRLGTHSAGRTLAHLHSIDGVVPVPLDPGPGPPPLSSTSTADGGGSEGNAAAGGGGAAPPAPTWHPLGRRPDRAVLRSAVLGFRSNHAAASVAGEAGWAAPDEPCYRPRRGPQGSSRQQQQQQPQVHGVMPFQSLSQQVPAVALQQQQQPAGVFGSGIPFPNRAGVAGQQQQGPHQHYWRNLRHVSRQLQRQMLLAATAAPLRSSATAVAPPLSLPHPPPSCGGGGPQQHQQQSRPDQHHQQQQLGLGAPALVVYVVPPSDSPEDVARALLEVAAALAPVTPAARAPPAAAALPPLVVPPGSAGVAAGGAACGGGSSRSGQGIASVHGTHSQDGRAVGWGGGASVSGSNGCMGGVASGVVGLGRGKDSSSGRQQQAGSSRASTPPEPPAPAAAAAAAHGAATTGSTVACTAAGAAAAGAASVRDADAGDPALLERLGGAARHLYRTTTTTNTPAMTPGATNSSSSHQDPQLDPASLPSTELVLQLVLPSTLHDISGASVRATACAAYSKLIRRRAAYGAAVAAVGSAGPTSGISGISGGFAAAPDAAAAGRGTLSSLSSCCNGNAASCCGSSDCRKRGSCSVLSSCSGCCSLYEPLVALAPQLQLQQQQQHPLPQPPPAAAVVALVKISVRQGRTVPPPF
ncbi:hypothetical protein Agub_g11424 [Astrephomene gubernaculifera]|uniref:Mediator of RNA polymerase II transcription subunit 13 n=1 Tax=Astrephomene gubernaculifera TaxID=47775 RepID=A0AAD3DWP9_9CHLO|nr:hypothetical protein Agub_g11424 [Astrephomene gubernaculifera]